jgi:hypothetical protein
MTIWQIAAGDSPERDYSEDVFLRYGVAAVGPGSRGSFTEQRADYEPGTPYYRDFLAPFCEGIEDGDLLVLKRPAGREWTILAVGQVDGDYVWEPRLGDVEGWDLQHCRRVRWRRVSFGHAVPGLRRGTLHRVQKPEVRQLAQRLWDDSRDRAVTATPLPDHLASPMDDEQMISLLIDHGIASATAETTAATLRRVRRVAGWYARVGIDIGEHEIRTFVVVPLLLALGWPEQRMRVEYQHADITLWDSPFSNPTSRVERVVETKHVYGPLGPGSIDQATRYADEQPWCHSIVVTDGFRWKLFDRGEDEGELSPWHPTAYVNLLEMRNRHPLDPRIGGAGQLFLRLLP